MSYSISLPIEFREKHDIRGGTYAVGGTTAAELSVTYNYEPHFTRVFGDGGIRKINGMSAVESIPLLTAAIDSLAAADIDDNYWASTEGNARAALCDLRQLAELAIRQYDGSAVWSVR